jgi:siroheme synthase-like protein
MSVFTVNLRVQNWPCLVVGGGAIALPKAQRLVGGGAKVTIIAPEVYGEVPGATILHRQATIDDLQGMRLAIIATDDRELNRRLWQEADRLGILAQAVDDPEAAHFYMPALLQRGDLEVAVSTSGECPQFAVWTRDHLAMLVDEAYGKALGWFGRLRRERLRALPMALRSLIFKKLMSVEFLTLFRSGRTETWDAQAEAIVQEAMATPGLPKAKWDSH